MTTTQPSTSPMRPASTPTGEQRQSFSFDLTVEQRNLRDVVKVVLHAICFHRVFGSVRPTTMDLCGITFPATQEPEIESMVEQHSAAFCRQIESKASKRADLLLFVLHPSTSTSSTGVRPSTGDAAAHDPDMGAEVSSSPVSAAGRSLKSWASSRAVSGYPYTWLAQAFSSGAAPGSTPEAEPSLARGDVSAARQQQQEAVEKERQRLEAQSFETWRIRFDVVPAKSERERLRLQSATANQLAIFLDELLVFVDEKKAHIPAIISADLCPFPIEVLGITVA